MRDARQHDDYCYSVSRQADYMIPASSCKSASNWDPAGSRSIPLTREGESPDSGGLDRRRSGSRLGLESVKQLNTLSQFMGRSRFGAETQPENSSPCAASGC